MAHLLVVPKTSRPTEIPISGERIVVGRDPHSDIQIDDPKISWHHLELRLEQGSIWLRDLASRNGTLVNGRLVKHSLLVHGDAIRIGDCNIRFMERRDFSRDTVH